MNRTPTPMPSIRGNLAAMTEPDDERQKGFTGDVLATAIYLAAVVLLALVVVAVLVAANAGAHNAPARVYPHTPAQ